MSTVLPTHLVLAQVASGEGEVGVKPSASVAAKTPLSGKLGTLKIATARFWS